MRITQKNFIETFVDKYQDQMEDIKDNFTSYEKITANDIVEINKAILKNGVVTENQLTDQDVFAFSNDKQFDRTDINKTLLCSNNRYSERIANVLANAAFVMCSLTRTPFFQENNVKTAMYAGMLVLKKNNIDFNISKANMQYFSKIVRPCKGTDGKEFDNACDNVRENLFYFYQIQSENQQEKELPDDLLK